MTQDKITLFVLATINDHDIHEATRRIAAEWKQDVEDARNEAYAEGVNAGREAA